MSGKSTATVHWRREQVFTPGKVPIFAACTTHGGEFPVHDHAFVEVVCVLSGRGRHVTQAGDLALRAGDVAVLRPGVWHGYRQAKRLRICNCCFGPELLYRELGWTMEDAAIGAMLWGPRSGGGVIQYHAGPGLVRRGAQELGPMRGEAGWAEPIGKLLTFLGALASAAPKGQAIGRYMPDFVAAVVRKLELRLSHAWTMAELSQIAGVGSAYLTRSFTAAMGVPPIAYLARCRAEQAAARLIQTRWEIADIGTSVGWDDPVYFARRFRQVYGMPPREYRRRFGRVG